MNRLLVAATLVLAAVLLRNWADPCSIPVTYRIGEVDQRFALQSGLIRTAIKRAEAVWEDATGRELFRYAEDGKVVINFVYDARQLMAQQNESRRDNIERAKSSAEEAKAAYDAASRKYDAARKDYEAAEARQEERVSAHNRDVEGSNARGGATAAENAAFRARAAELETSAQTLEKKRLEINALAERANSLSRRYNEFADEVNANVEAVNATAGREFKQGRYLRNSEGERIDVFEFVDTEDLVHLLAHELGHALGIDHVESSESIMYGRSSTRSVIVTPEDRQALRDSCRL